MSIDLGRRLIAAGVVPPEEVEAALFLSVVRGVPFARVLLDRGALSERGLEEELERVGGLGLRQVAGAAEIVARLPRAMCRRLAALPTRVDPASGAVDVAAADPLDAHVAAEFGFHLGVPIRVLRAPIVAIEEAIRRLELDEQEAPERVRPRRVTPAFPHGAPQSSIPPPVIDEAPIPLVRKIAGTAPPTPRSATARPPDFAGAAAAVPRGAPSLATPAPPAEALGAPDPDEDPAAEGEPRPLRRPRLGVTAPRPALLRELPQEPPAVSFPSTPPPEQGAPAVTDARPDRITPPYGTPLLAPPAAPVEIVSRTASPEPAPFGRDEAVAAGPRSEPLPRVRPKSALPRDGVRRPARPSLTADLHNPPAARPAPRALEEAITSEDDAPEPEPLPKRVRAPDGGPVLAGLRQAETRDEVVRLALRGMHLVARRLAVFVVRRDGFRGWACNVAFGDQDALKELSIAAEQPSVLATAAATAMYLGPIPSTPPHEGLLRIMERASHDVAAIAVRVQGRPALVLLADEFEDTMTGTRFLGELARAVGEALTRLLAPR